MQNNKLSEKQFLFFTLNYIVGFGFIATISSVIQTGYLGIVIFIMTALITTSVALVFSRLGNIYNKEYGGSYLYAKKAFNKRFAFFQGWNQFIQGPILAATSPLFIADALSYITSDATAILIIRIASIALFIILVLVSTFGIHFSKKVILASSIVKWTVLLLGVGIVIYFAFSDLQFSTNFSTNNNVGVYLVFSNVLSFMYAFGGFEDVSAMSADVKIKNFRKVLMIAFAIILSFYFVVFILINGLANIVSISNFSYFYNLAFGITGVVIFVVGLIFNGISSKISISISTSRKIIPLAMDGYLPRFIIRQNKYGEYKNAIWFAAILTIISMFIFWLIPLLTNQSNFFNQVINLGTAAFLVQYMLTLITALYMSYKKMINKIPLWEQIFYYLGILIIIVTLLIYVIPPIVGESWTDNNTIVIVSYIIFILIGYGLYWYRRISDKKQSKFKLVNQMNDVLEQKKNSKKTN